ncbi:MAG TPA: phosphohydrolase [Phycisphaerae bacterium]|nr:phosphohydrolase [Phycisphaerae bacterium]HNU45367.1 phosphohydrolase [Phycisphaerae bacterium]
MSVTGEWIQTYTGRRVDPFNLQPQDVVIEDIAHALSLIARFGGHCARFYSVAQHSLIVSVCAPNEYQLWGLLHDAAEAYLGDIPRPIKRRLPGFLDVEDKVLRAIATRFGLYWPMPDIIKQLDTSALRFEAGALMGNTRGWKDLAEETPTIDAKTARPLLYLRSPEAEQRVLDRFLLLTTQTPT